MGQLSEHEAGEHLVAVERSVVGPYACGGHAAAAEPLGRTGHALRSGANTVNVEFRKRNKRCGVTELYESLKPGEMSR